MCHSDLNLLFGYFPFATYPRVPGHGVAAKVLDLMHTGKLRNRGVLVME